MAVQIYQNEELNDICFEVDALEEWKNLTKELGLNSQESFVKSSESPNPYPYINASMARIFETLCPTKVAVNKYDKTPIPLEVLKQLSYSKKENHFNEYEIWYDDKSPDPFLVGVTCQYYGKYKIPTGGVSEITNEKGETKYFDSLEDMDIWCLSKNVERLSYTKASWGSSYKRYLIARWADVIRPIPELKELAKQRLLESYGATIKNEIEQKTQALKKLENNVILFLSGDITEHTLKGC